MIIGDRLRELRGQKNMSQGDIAERTGLFCCYISRVENGHTVPAIQTLEKFARALEIPMYQLFYEGEELPSPKSTKKESRLWGSSGKDAHLLLQFRRSLSNVKEKDRTLLLHMARKLARGKAA